MAARVRHKAGDEKGWTLVELLVSMMILGMIAAIAVPSFIGQRRGGDDASTKAIARATAAAMEAYAQNNLGAYDGVNPTKINAIDPNIPINQIDVSGADCANSSTNSACYTIDAVPPPSVTGTKYRLVELKDGSMTSDCDIDPGTSGWQHSAVGNSKNSSGCPADGDWFN